VALRNILITLAALLSLAAAGIAAAEPAEQIWKETLAVVNAEVPVRVFLDGVPLAGLQKEDFRLFEGKLPQQINGFYQRRKKMRVERIDLLAARGAAEPAPRYFVLCFRILDYNEALSRGMDYFFRHVLRERDQLLVLVNERTLLLNQDVWQVKRREILEQVLQEEAVKARQELEVFFLRVQKDIDQARLRALLEREAHTISLAQVLGMLQDYLNVWQEFKKKYLLPDLDKFYNFARHLQNIRAEKWVLNFFQIEVFPKMRFSGPLRRQIDDLVMAWAGAGGTAEQFSREIVRTLDAIDRALNMAGEFPVEEIGKMLIRVDTTYHCFISSAGAEGMSADLEFRQVASDLENSLRAITKSSGGDVVFSGDIGSALHAIGEKEDIYYVLTYEPKSRARAEKVKIEVNRPRCQLFYDDQIRSDYIAEYLEKKKAEDPTLQLDRISLSGSRLQLGISSFKMLAGKTKKSGQLKVAIRIRDGQDRVLYDQGRVLAAQEATVALAVDFTFLPPGRYLFLVEVSDVLTGRTVMDTLLADVPEPVLQPARK